jgi:hypothetical protein
MKIIEDIKNFIDEHFINWISSSYWFISRRDDAITNNKKYRINKKEDLINKKYWKDDERW